VVHIETDCAEGVVRNKVLG